MARSPYKHDYRNVKKLERLRELAGAERDFTVNIARDRVRGPHSEIAWYAFLQLLLHEGYADVTTLGKSTYRIQIVKELPATLSDASVTERNRALKARRSQAVADAIAAYKPPVFTVQLPRDVLADLRAAIAAAREAGIDVKCSYARIV